MRVFAIEGLGGDPLRATGALLLDLPGAIRRSVAERSEVFWSVGSALGARQPLVELRSDARGPIRREVREV